MAIYTKKGDKGDTGVFLTKERVSKASVRIRAIGEIDEANSFLGIVNSFSKDPLLVGEIKKIQRNLFKIGSILAGSRLRISPTETRKVERAIDKLEGTLPVLKNFILPGGTKVASLLFMARTLIRKAERAVVTLAKKEKVASEILIYLNRLSDYLFMLAREINYREKIKEEAWRGGGPTRR